MVTVAFCAAAPAAKAREARMKRCIAVDKVE